MMGGFGTHGVHMCLQSQCGSIKCVPVHIVKCWYVRCFVSSCSGNALCSYTRGGRGKRNQDDSIAYELVTALDGSSVDVDCSCLCAAARRLSTTSYVMATLTAVSALFSFSVGVLWLVLLYYGILDQIFD
eukprot:5440578-Pyramimonas_sp.AAC.1